jgi:hypothetical protein
MVLGKAKTAVVAAVSVGLTACGLLTWNVRGGDFDWLASCPLESRRAVNELDFPDYAMAWLDPGPNVLIPDRGAVEVRDGYVEAKVVLSTHERGYVGRIAGEIRTGSDGASVHFTNFRLWREVDSEDAPPTGPEIAICAIASVRGSRERPGIPRIEHPVRPSELHSGYVPVTTAAMEIQFAR